MKKMIEFGNNSPQEYDRIFAKRKIKGPDRQDVRRWKLMLKHHRGGKILDIGCLDSLIPVLAKGKYPDTEAHAVDLAEEAITEMRRTYPFVYYRVADAYALPYPDSSFDSVYMGEIIEHLNNPENAIKEALRVTKPDGWLVISSPLDEASEPGAVDAERHLYSFDQTDMKQMLKESGNIEFAVLRSQLIPYRYHFPTLITYCRKYASPVHTP